MWFRSDEFIANFYFIWLWNYRYWAIIQVAIPVGSQTISILYACTDWTSRHMFYLLIWCSTFLFRRKLDIHSRLTHMTWCNYISPNGLTFPDWMTLMEVTAIMTMTIHCRPKRKWLRRSLMHHGMSRGRRVGQSVGVHVAVTGCRVVLIETSVSSRNNNFYAKPNGLV